MNILTKLRTKGPAHYAKRMLEMARKFFRPRWQRLFLFESPLDSFVTNKYDEAVKLRILRETDDALLAFAGRRGPWYAAQAADLFSKGNLCFVAVIDGVIASCLWTSFNKVYLPDIEYTLYVEPDIAPLIDGYTLDEFRGKGLYKILWNECHNHLVATGKYSKIYGFINNANKRSLAVHDKLNLNKIILDITLIKFVGIRIHLKRKPE
jgi:hypothetical protein